MSSTEKEKREKLKAETIAWRILLDLDRTSVDREKSVAFVI
jgi:hypothetical protein